MCLVSDMKIDRKKTKDLVRNYIYVIFTLFERLPNITLNLKFWY